jgi:hypothetical protein
MVVIGVRMKEANTLLLIQNFWEAKEFVGD